MGLRDRKPTVLSIDAGGTHAVGHLFWKADNGVWLVDEVPTQFLGFATQEASEG